MKRIVLDLTDEEFERLDTLVGESAQLASVLQLVGICVRAGIANLERRATQGEWRGVGFVDVRALVIEEQRQAALGLGRTKRVYQRAGGSRCEKRHPIKGVQCRFYCEHDEHRWWGKNGAKVVWPVEERLRVNI